MSTAEFQQYTQFFLSNKQIATGREYTNTQDENEK